MTSNHQEAEINFEDLIRQRCLMYSGLQLPTRQRQDGVLPRISCPVSVGNVVRYPQMLMHINALEATRNVP